MTPMEAWGIIQANLEELYKKRRDNQFKGFSDSDIEAEVACFQALKLMEEGLKKESLCARRKEVPINDQGTVESL